MGARIGRRRLSGMGDSKAVAVDGSAAIPASITNLAALQYLAMGADGSQLTGTYEGLAWLSSLSNLQSLYALHTATPSSQLTCPDN
ncbi:unnamed protein product, partial [Closterium sp. Naga37s-1]